MKKIFEGATVVSAILLVLVTTCTFIFNVSHKMKKSSKKHHYEKKISHIEEEQRKRAREEKNNITSEFQERLREEEERHIPKGSRVRKNPTSDEWEIIHTFKEDPSPRQKPLDN